MRITYTVADEWDRKSFSTYTTESYDQIWMTVDEEGDFSFKAENPCDCKETCNSCCDEECGCCGESCSCMGGSNDCDECHESCECDVSAEECWEDHWEDLSPREATDGRHDASYYPWGKLVDLRVQSDYEVAVMGLSASRRATTPGYIE